MVLEKMCDNYERLPPSYEITGELEWTEENLIGRGGKADVWRGVYEGFQVAVKVLRVDLGMDLVALEKVDPRLPSSCTDESGTGILPGGGQVEAVQTPEPVTVRRHKKSVANSDDRLRMDGTRHYHGVRHRAPRVKSAEAGKRFLEAQGKYLLPSFLQLADVARGLKYLHDWPTVHADLKSVSPALEYLT